MNTNTDMSADAKLAVATGLEQVLGATFTLYFRAHSFHWNVEGPMFFGLHAAFEEDYTDLWNSIDGYAERIRALGAKAPDSLMRLISSSELRESDAASDAVAMVREMVAGHHAVAGIIRTTLRTAQEHGDEVSAGLLADRLQFHEKRAWMLGCLTA